MKKNRLILSLLMLGLLSACSKQPEGLEVEEANNHELVEVEEKGEKKMTIKNIEAEDFHIESDLDQLQAPKSGDTIARMKTNFGEISIRLFPEIAPKAVENFVEHSKSGYYDGVSFHRIIEDFMIQGGDPEGTGRGGESIWGQAFEDEFSLDYHNFRGALSMANAGPGTNGSQFFIVQKRDVDDELVEEMKRAGDSNGFTSSVIKAYEEIGGTPWLDYGHTVFGQVYKGMNIVDEIASIDTDPNGMPYEPIVIESIEIEIFE